LDLTDETHGNAVGIGLADLTTRRLVEKINYQETFVNVLTSGQVEAGKIPVFLSSDREAILSALRICGPIKGSEVKIVRIKNTGCLEEFWISEYLASIAKKDLSFKNKIEVYGKPKEMQFDVLGNLAR
jgi:hypothetical protein